MSNGMIGIIDVVRFENLVAERFLSCRRHPTAPLLIWNYTARAAYEKVWTAETMMCRGLVTTTDGEIVARPFPKFFNLEEWVAMGREVPAEPFDVYEKLDGSLGILYHTATGPAIATRGSFDSVQALEGTRILNAMGPHDWPRDLTFLFEIIYPENRIVCNYGGRRELVLLAVVETATGREMPLSEWSLPAARRYDGITDLSAIRSLGKANEEGFVVRFASGLRLKLKLEEYVRLHRLLTGVTPRRVWEILSRGESLEPMLQAVPEEFETWLRSTAATLRQKYDNIVNRCIVDYDAIPQNVSRKEQAAIVTRCPYPAVLFRMLDGKDHAPLIWKEIYPPPASAFKCDEDS